MFGIRALTLHCESYSVKLVLKTTSYFKAKTCLTIKSMSQSCNLSINQPVLSKYLPAILMMLNVLALCVNKRLCFSGYEELDNLLAPKLKGFELALKQLQGHAEAVYDVTIAYSNTTDPSTGERIPAPGMPGKC